MMALAWYLTSYFTLGELKKSKMNLLVEFIIAIYIISFIFLQIRLDFLTKILPRVLMMSLCFCRKIKNMCDRSRTVSDCYVRKSINKTCLGPHAEQCFHLQTEIQTLLRESAGNSAFMCAQSERQETVLANERAAKSERSAFQSGQFRFLHHTENSLKVMWGQLAWKAKVKWTFDRDNDPPRNDFQGRIEGLEKEVGEASVWIPLKGCGWM